jgi:DmsE family decaheme c-type cytochrome
VLLALPVAGAPRERSEIDSGAKNAAPRSGADLAPSSFGDNGAAAGKVDTPGNGVKPTPGAYAGNAECKTCHQDQWDGFFKNPHFKSLASGKEPPEVTACEGCHGPLQAHVAAGKSAGRDTVPFAFTAMKPREIIDRCLTCHAKDESRTNIRRSEHTQNDVACTACHSNHSSKTPRFLLAKSEPEACYQCHGDVRAQFNMPSRHRVNEGFMQCSDCHNPHGGSTPNFGMGQSSRMLNRSHGSEQPCLKCHVDKRGPFIFEHGPGEIDGCISCHSPHGTTNGKLLRRTTVAQLCLECHTGTGSFGARSTRGIQVPDAATHNLLDPTYQKCTMCHQRIHGSNVHYRFLR